ncbi:MAG: polysaccharide biosynthesis tyrosine autokinase [Gelidibacter sp.]|nr:polysaccharide biosynthesis tyrosine autokinase [Gelidibacter sp.]
MQDNNQFNPINDNDESINLREQLENYLFHWKWFVLGIAVALIGAFFYLRYSTNQYTVATTILVDDKNSGGLASELSAFQDLGMFGSSKAVLDNEIELLKSKSLAESVVKSLRTNVEFYIQGNVIESELFRGNAPVKINFFSPDSVFHKLDTMFAVSTTSSSTFILKDAAGKKSKNHNFGELIKTSYGELTITPLTTGKFKDNEEVIIKIVPFESVVNRYRNALQIQPVSKQASVLQLSLTDPVKPKAIEILDNLVAQYNNDAVEDKNLTAKNTNDFINQRILIVNEELSSVEKGAEQFKRSNQLTDLATEAGLAVQSKSLVEKEVLELNTQLKLAEYVSDYVNANPGDLIPANLGIGDASVDGNTEKYNQLVLERNRILKGSSEINPVIVNLNGQIKNLEESIKQSLKNSKAALKISLNAIKGQQSKFASTISEVPQQERMFRDMQRQQQIMETIYLYLLQKREENAITMAVTLPSAKIIDTAYGSNTPVAPKRNIIYLAALLLGLLIPFGVIYILALLDNKIHTRKEVEAMVKAPILGDIPKSNLETKIVVSDSDRSSIAESFRLLRTNLNFMLTSVKDGGKTIFITSTVSGEGKTFVSINLAAVLSLTDKKVLLIGADIRKPKIGDYLDLKYEKGLTHYLMDDTMKVTDIIESVNALNFDFISSSLIPPNPSELLMNGRFEEVLAYGKQHYDYVIVDTAPVNLVTDTLLLSHLADMFIYVVRANYLDKRLLSIPKMMYEDKRLPNMAVLINSTDLERGYGYGYGYGYTYYKEGAKKPWYKKLFTK